MTTSLGIGLAVPCISLAGGGGGPPPEPATTYPNGFRYQVQRIIPAAVHQMPTGGSGWFQYRHTAVSLKSVANGGKVENGTVLDHRFETGNTAVQHEIEAWSATVGLIVAWLLLPGFQNGIDYQIFHYYGNAALTQPQANPVSAWAGFMQSNNLATGSDMTGNQQHFTLIGVAAAQLAGAGAGDFG